ncbi:MAG: hypothetical protein ACRED5_03385 [Propylenella sp.]
MDGKELELPWRVLDAFSLGQRIIVLFDPDAYLVDPSQENRIRRNPPQVRNLVAYSREGEKLWEAEFPESEENYYYRIEPRRPLRAASFSSYVCEIDPATGRIVSMEFVK